MHSIMHASLFASPQRWKYFLSCALTHTSRFDLQYGAGGFPAWGIPPNAVLKVHFSRHSFLSCVLLVVHDALHGTYLPILSSRNDCSFKTTAICFFGLRACFAYRKDYLQSSWRYFSNLKDAHWLKCCAVICASHECSCTPCDTTFFKFLSMDFFHRLCLFITFRIEFSFFIGTPDRRVYQSADKPLP